mmetsp:Transcript_28361/g.80060  ORF Transcript_28361/g.80060 Transcript_28361/m.80060 type:complete len:344 (-) Transcript_28361:256-1287(-)
MAPCKVAVNGFGRIGRLVFRELFKYPDLFEVVHVNDVAPVESSAYLALFDSVHGTWEHDCVVEGSNMAVKLTSGTRIVTYSVAATPAEIPLDGIDIVLECSGKFLTREKLQPFFDKGIKKVIVSAPVKDPNPVLNIVYGCNHDKYNANVDHLITAASCTTNCLAPVVKVIHEKLGIKHGCITTCHNVTNTQTVLDCPNFKKSDLRRARSGLVNLAPTSTGSATAIALVYPELKGKLNGLAIRVPLTNSSITDCVFEVNRSTDEAEVNKLLKEASETYLKDILGFEERPLVSTDYINDRRSGIVDALSTQVIDGTMVKLYVWYDNEFGYSMRMIDITKMVAEKL